MAKHVEQSVREAFAAILSAAIPSASVFPARAFPVGVENGATAIEILQSSETVTPFGSCAGADYERVLEIMVVGYCVAAGAENAANARAALRLQVEAAIHSAGPDHAAFDGLVEEVTLTRTDMALDPAAYGRAAFASFYAVRSTASIADMQSAS